AGAVDHREQFVRPAAVDLVAEVGMGEVQGYAGAPRDLDAVLVGLERVQTVVPVVCMSTKPGQTSSPSASITRAAGSVARRPAAATRPSAMPTSAVNHGLPAPSTTRPP